MVWGYSATEEQDSKYFAVEKHSCKRFSERWSVASKQNINGEESESGSQSLYSRTRQNCVFSLASLLGIGFWLTENIKSFSHDF